jgi:hypothetical protein
MKEVDQLNQLFETLRTEHPTTSISEVSSWINAGSVITNVNTIKKLTLKKIIIMSSIVSISLIGVIALFSLQNEKKDGKQHLISKHEVEKNETSIKQKNNKSEIQEVNTNDSKSSLNNKVILENLPIEATKTNELQSEIVIPVLKEKNESELNSNTNLMNKENEYYAKSKNENIIRTWKSINDSLKVDTLFNDVKALVFKGDKSDIVIQGSERTSISMNYNYKLKAKGVFSKKKGRNCELSYELKDSVLTIRVKQKDQNFNGVSILSETSKLEFIVPNNIDVKMNSDLGDIDVNGLKANTIKLYTALGDITAENVSGNIDLNTDLGDISMNDLSGKINSVTSLGDIQGEHILLSDNSTFNTSLGDIDIQLSNTLSDCSLELSSSLGKVKVDRPDLKKKSGSQLILGNGKLKVIMETSLGKVIVR